MGGWVPGPLGLASLCRLTGPVTWVAGLRRVVRPRWAARGPRAAGAGCLRGADNLLLPDFTGETGLRRLCPRWVAIALWATRAGRPLGDYVLPDLAVARPGWATLEWQLRALRMSSCCPDVAGQLPGVGGGQEQLLPLVGRTLQCWTRAARGLGRGGALVLPLPANGRALARRTLGVSAHLKRGVGLARELLPCMRIVV